MKYGRGLIPRDEVQRRLAELTAQGYVCAEDVKYVIPMAVDDFLYHVSELRRNFLYSDYEFKDFDSFREPFHSFIDDLKEKTQVILSEGGDAARRGPVSSAQDLRDRKAEILLGVFRSYLQYGKRGRRSVPWACLVPAAMALALLALSYTPKPF